MARHMKKEERGLSSGLPSYNRPAIARYFTPAEIAAFHSELDRIRQDYSTQRGVLTARELNKRAAEILLRAKGRPCEARSPEKLGN